MAYTHAPSTHPLASVAHFVSKAGYINPTDALHGKRVVGLYFSAHWCAPCREFTPTLAQFYNHQRTVNPGSFEVVFVSSDRRDGFEKYYATMPWLAVPHDEEAASSLRDRYGVSGIPALVLLDSDGTVITNKGREWVSQRAGAFPWGIKPAPDMGAETAGATAATVSFYDAVPEA